MNEVKEVEDTMKVQVVVIDQEVVIVLQLEQVELETVVIIMIGRNTFFAFLARFNEIKEINQSIWHLKKTQIESSPQQIT